MLSRVLMRSKEVGNAQSVQQTTDIFFNSTPTLPGEKKCQGVLMQKCVDKYTKHVRLFIKNISHAWFPIVVLEEDKYVVKRLDEAPHMQFPGVLSRTSVTDRFFYQNVHALSARFRKTRRYTKVVCCVLNLCTRLFLQTVHGDQTVHALSARFRKTRRYTKVVRCVLKLCTRFPIKLSIARTKPRTSQRRRARTKASARTRRRTRRRPK